MLAEEERVNTNIKFLKTKAKNPPEHLNFLNLWTRFLTFLSCTSNKSSFMFHHKSLTYLI